MHLFLMSGTSEFLYWLSLMCEPSSSCFLLAMGSNRQPLPADLFCPAADVLLTDFPSDSHIPFLEDSTSQWIFSLSSEDLAISLSQLSDFLSALALIFFNTRILYVSVSKIFLPEESVLRWHVWALGMLCVSVRVKGKQWSTYITERFLCPSFLWHLSDWIAERRLLQRESRIGVWNLSVLFLQNSLLDYKLFSLLLLC